MSLVSQTQSSPSDVAPPPRGNGASPYPPEASAPKGEAVQPFSEPSFQRFDQCEPFPFNASEYLRRVAWEWVERLFMRLSPRRAYAWRRFWLRAFGATIARKAEIRPNVRIWHPWLLEMGEHATLADGVTIYNLGRVRLGEHSVLSQNVYVCAGTHDYSKPSMPLIRPQIDIGNGVWVAAGAFIGPGVKIGDNSVIGAGAVVMKDIPGRVIAAGNPAVVIKPRRMDAGPPAGA